jgi:hypothetical protein
MRLRDDWVRGGARTNVNYVDSGLLNLTEWLCHRFQRLTGRTNVWLAVQFTNLSIVVYFVWAAAFFWNRGLALRVVLAIFCGVLLYVLTQTVFKVPIEAYEQSAYRRVAKGLRNPRRFRDAPLRIAFLSLSLFLAYPLFLAYSTLHLHVAFLTYLLILLTTIVLYLLACDPLPPCAGTLREWLRGTVRSRVQSASSRAAGAPLIATEGPRPARRSGPVPPEG